MNAGKSLLASFVLVAIATTLVLPNRKTPAVILSLFNGLTASVKTTVGL